MSTIKSSTQRHLSIDGLEEYLRHDVPTERPIPGEPQLTIFVDPTRPAIGLRAPKTSDDDLPRLDLEHLRVREIMVEGQRRWEISVVDRDLFLDSYGVFLTIADRIQLDGMSVTSALSDTLRLLGRLLERRESLSEDHEVGLFGELSLFLGLIFAVGARDALAAWRGWDGEEHDFGLQGIDIEVKTTTSERRAHWIGSLTQVVPTLGRHLWLVSYQLTRAAPDDGQSLPELIDIVRKVLNTESSRGAFDENLLRSGWRASFAHTCRSRWRLRTAPAAFHIVDDFPRLTSELLATAGVDLSHLIDVRYRVDLTHRVHGANAPSVLLAALSHGGST